MWSEHCSYKSSKVHLRRFADSAPPIPALLAGIGQDAGVVDIGQGYAVTFKVESHNHPSYVEPFQGAATGVGGIVRDILAMGARPVAVMDSLRFGPAQNASIPTGCCPGWWPASRSTATAWACPTSAVNSPSTPATAGIRWSTRCGARVMRRPGPQAGRGPRDRKPGHPVRLPDRPGWHRRRFGAGQCTFGGAALIPPSGPASRSAIRSWRSC